MSAWMVTKKHIDLLVTEAVALELEYEFNGRKIKLTKGIENSIRQMLTDECRRSINYRYQEDTETGIYRFKKYVEQTLTDEAIAKQVRCYDYQACECPDYYETETRKFVEALSEKLGWPLDGEKCPSGPWGV